MKRRNRFNQLLPSATALALLAGLPHPAQPQTWDGGGEQDGWSEKRNWNPDKKPKNNGTANLVFTGSERLEPAVDRSWDVHSITFDSSAGAFTVVAESHSPGVANEAAAPSLTIQQGGVTNQDVDAQTIHANIRLGAGQTWDAVAGELIFKGPIDNQGHQLTVAGNQDVLLQGVLAGEGGLIKTGSGTTELKAQNSFTGNLVINQGTLLFGQEHAVDNSVALTLGGGTLASGGYAGEFGTLTVAANSAIDLGDGASFLQFANSSATSWAHSILSIDNWSGSVAGGGTDQLLFGNAADGLTSAQTSKIVFRNPAGLSPGTYQARMLASGEVVPVPEPAGVAVSLLLAAFVTVRERKKLLRWISAPPQAG